jgi:ribosomal protein L31E
MCVWHCLLRFSPLYSQLFGRGPLVDLRRFRTRRSGHAHEAAKPILEIEKLLQGHVQEAVELAQHLLCPLAKRLALWRKGNKNPPLAIRLSIGESERQLRR